MSDRLVQSVLAYAQSLLMTSLCAQTVVPSQSNQILTMPIQQLVSQIKVPFAFPSRFATPILPLFRCLKGVRMGPTGIPVLLSSQTAGLSPHMRSYSIQRVPNLHIGPYDSKNFSQVRSSTFHMLTLVQSLRTPSQFTSPVRERRDTCLLPRPEVYVDTYAVSSRSSTVSDSPRR